MFRLLIVSYIDEIKDLINKISGESLGEFSTEDNKRIKFASDLVVVLNRLILTRNKALLII